MKLPKILKPKISFREILRGEFLFLLFVVFSVVKLTGTQYIMTSTSGFPLWKMTLRNIFFLYFLWRLAFLSGKRISPVFIYILQTLFMGILLLVYEYSGEIILLSQLFTLKEGLTAIGSLSTVVFKPSNLILVSDIPLLLIVMNQYHRIRKSLLPLFPPIILLTGIGLYMLLVKLDYFKGTGTEWGILGRQAKYGTIYTSLVLSDTSNQKDAIKSIVYGPEITIPEKDIKSNVITIQVESLTADILFQEYKGQRIMPFLSRLASENIYYPYLIAQHKTGASSDAEFSAINGVEAIRGFPACQFTIYEYPNSFIKQFPPEVNTLVFHANTGSYFNRSFNLPAMGFNKFYDLFGMELNEKKWGGSDGDLFSFAVKILNEEKNPYYYHIITMTSHGPFNLVYTVYSNDRFDDIPVKEERDYFTSMAYVDSVLAEGISELRKIDPLAYIFIYGDHSIKLRGDNYKGSSYLFTDSRKFEFVPLIIISPYSVQYKETKKVSSILDIAVSVLDASGYGGTIKSFGRSLLEPEKLNNTFPNDGKLYSRAEIFRLIEADN